MSAIEWTDTTWNPTVGCTRVSAGCKNCYAFESHDRRHKGYPWPNAPKQYAKPFSEVQLMPERLDAPLHWRKPRRVFVNSMSDLFHEDIPDEFLDRVFDVMENDHCNGRHEFQILTKRPQRMRDYLSARWAGPAELIHIMPGWLWLGVSVENQATADERIPLLLETPAAVRFLSCEPLLGPVDLSRWIVPARAEWQCSGCGTFAADWSIECRHCGREHYLCGSHVANGRTQPIDWVIVGGESGPKARPCNVEWIRGIVGQCKAASVPVFVKQLGARPTAPHPVHPDDPNYMQDWPAIVEMKNRKGGDPSEWPEDLRVREFPK